MGRNGSDLTAALVAEAVGTHEVQLWKAVGGMMTADPEIVPDARVIEHLGFQEATEYAFHGAEVLYGPALSPVQRGGITVRILDVHDPAARGTILEARTRGEGPVGIAARRSVLRVDLAIGASELRAPRVAELFTVLARHRVEPGVDLDLRRPHQRARRADGQRRGRGRRAGSPRVGRARPGARGRDRARHRLRHDAGRAHSLELLSEERVEVAEAFVGVRAPSQVFVVPADELERTVRVLHAGLLSPVRARS